jgi:hypothetical protein
MTMYGLFCSMAVLMIRMIAYGRWRSRLGKTLVRDNVRVDMLHCLLMHCGHQCGYYDLPEWHTALTVPKSID